MFYVLHISYVTSLGQLANSSPNPVLFSAVAFTNIIYNNIYVSS